MQCEQLPEHPCPQQRNVHRTNGYITHNNYDQSLGPVEVGAELVQTIVEGDEGDYRTHIFKNESVSIDILH